MRLFPKRRWLRYSIRTLLIAVMVFCVWLGWQVSIVRERRSFVEWNKARFGRIEWWQVNAIENWNKLAPAMAPPWITMYELYPRWRTWLGDAPANYVHMNPGLTTLSDRQNA